MRNCSKNFILIVSIAVVQVYIFVIFFYNGGRGRFDNVFKQLSLLQNCTNINETAQLQEEVISTTPSSTVETTLFKYMYTTLGLDPRFPITPGDMGTPVEIDFNDTDVEKLAGDGLAQGPQLRANFGISREACSPRDVV
ncbi:uncharacterized protein LOC125769065 [Anopheles funestus]|uniref:uncharacterized protein LOC125769065 n=1 Tax=Anopheles funestus TaxID=62324 RepID=UPI0020C6AE71|nr:uncharacterized protein LOC125769065 [Anopheles funestus]